MDNPGRCEGKLFGDSATGGSFFQIAPGEGTDLVFATFVLV